MAGETKTTTNHDEIRKWAEARGGKPVHVNGSLQASESGSLRIDFVGEGQGEEELHEISWDAFFRDFDDQQLSFVYQDDTGGGQLSRFCKLVKRDGLAQAIVE